MRSFAILLPVLALTACASGSWRPRSLKTEPPLIERGWSYSEPEKSFLNLESGGASQSYGGPILVSEKLIFGSERFGVTALAKRNGQVLWQRKFPEGVSVLPHHHDGSVFVGTEAGSLHRLNVDSGAETWASPLGAPLHGTVAFGFGRMFAATADEALHAVDPTTGKILWTYRRPSFSGTSIKGGGNPAIVAGKIWMGFSDGTLVSLNPDTGAMESEKAFRDNLKFMDLDAKILGWKEGLLVSTYDGKLRYLRKDGSIVWEFPAGSARAPVLAENDVIYLPSSDGNVYAIQGASGKELWRFSLKRGVATGITPVSRGTERLLLVTGSEERLLLLDNKGNLLTEAAFGRGSGSFAPIALDAEANSFYVLSSYSRIYQFRMN